MLKKSWWSALALLLALLLSTTSYAASTVSVPQNVTPVKSWTVVVGITYKIPNDVKQTGDSYTSSNTAILTVNASTGQFTPQAAGIAYIVATNGGQSRYFKVTASTTISTAPATSVFGGHTVTVNNTTTVATGGYYSGNPAVYYFHSADRIVLGSIPGTSAYAIQTANGGTQAPDGFGEDWSSWFAEQFNLYRGLGARAGTALASDNAATTIEQYRQEVVRLTNIERENAGLPSLTIDEDAMAFAQIRAQEIVENYSHTRPNGERLEVNGLMVSENIGAAKNTPELQVSSWMNSEGHRGNILNSDAYAIGVGVYQSSGGTWYWVQTFVW